jgi:sporulation protein YlmC with PRC-barrel domain
MTPDSPIKLVSELLDLPLFDVEENYCGVVDDVELEGAPGKPLKLKALLVGPGAYSGRLPRWAISIVAKVAGDRVARVPMDKVRTIGTAVHMECPGRDLGLHKSETAAGRWLPHWGAL